MLKSWPKLFFRILFAFARDWVRDGHVTHHTKIHHKLLKTSDKEKILKGSQKIKDIVRREKGEDDNRFLIKSNAS